LGKALFWDEQLSSTRTVACGTCHFATSGGSDARSSINSTRARNPGADAIFNTADDVFASPGVISNNSDGTYNWSAAYGFGEQVTGRKAKSYVDAGYSNTLFWDGRATATFADPIGGGVVLQNGAALESQVLGPPVSAAEMAHVNRNWNEVAVRVAQAKPLALSPSVPAALNAWIDGRTYSQLFEEAFGTPEVTRRASRWPSPRSREPFTQIELDSIKLSNKLRRSASRNARPGSLQSVALQRLSRGFAV